MRIGGSCLSPLFFLLSVMGNAIWMAWLHLQNVCSQEDPRLFRKDGLREERSHGFKKNRKVYRNHELTFDSVEERAKITAIRL